MQSHPNEEKKFQASALQPSASHDHLQAFGQEEQVLAHVLNVAGQGVVQLENEGEIRFATSAGSSLFGYSPEEMMGQYWKDRLPTSEHEKFQKALQQVSPGNTVTIQTVGLTKSNSTIALDITFVADPDTPTSRRFCLIREARQSPPPPDFPTRSESEATLQKRNQALEQKVQHLTSSNDELERFAYVASHDLQEPLRMISSFMQLLQKEYSHQLDSTALQYIHFAVDGAERMKGLISDLLEYSRVGSNRDPYTSVDINEVLREQLKVFEPLIVQNQAIIEISAMPTVKGNKTQLGQLFQNLISNGLKYRRQMAPLIRLNAREEANEWILSVSDNGIGIDAKFFDKIFLIFQRLHGIGKYPGSGIGLTICKKIVEQHGGRIWLESTLGQGSTFYVALPKAA